MGKISIVRVLLCFLVCKRRKDAERNVVEYSYRNGNHNFNILFEYTLIQIGLHEFVPGGQNRLTWPFGDQMPGNYHAKLTMPAFLLALGFAVRDSSRMGLLSALLALFSMVATLLTGERINTLIKFFSGTLAIMLCGKSILKSLKLFSALILAFVAMFAANAELAYRFITKFYEQLPFQSSSNYFETLYGGILAFQNAPITGIGTATYRVLCSSLEPGKFNVACNTHPHNFYVQVIGELGAVVFAAFLVMVTSITLACAKPAISSREDLRVAVAPIIPFAFFFPLQTTADFFGQWNNIFMWTALALALSMANVKASLDQILGMI